VRTPPHPRIEQVPLPAVLHALSDPARLAIVRALGSDGEMACGSLPVQVSKSTLTHHLKVLREGGVTLTRCQGVQRLVSLRFPELERRFPGLLDAILRRG
jgi:DNA-binding transcriptional ArsR family regulator